MAAALYLQLIEAAGSEIRSAERAVVRRHVAQMLPLLPEETRANVSSSPEAFQRGEGALRPGVGGWLAVWWRRQDPLPATGRNERIIEHLQRVRVAERRYAADRTAAGLDDRGHIYVRLGAPSRVIQLDNEAIEEDGLSVLAENTLAVAIVPQHELWIYDALGEYAQYVFVKQGGHFVLGAVRDLLPATLRRPSYSTSELGIKRAWKTLRVLRDYYEQLYRLRPEYLSLLNQIDGYLLRVDDDRLAERMNLYSGNSNGNITSPPGTGPEPLFLFAGQVIADVRREDRRLARRRKETVPTVRTRTVDTKGQFPVVAHTARFLGEDGTTQTEVYWAVDPADLAPSPADRLRLAQQGLLTPDQHLLRLTSVRYGPEYAARSVSRTDYQIDTNRGEPAVYSLRLPGVRDGYHLALQWDQYAVGSDSTAAFVRRGAVRADSLQPLHAAANRLTLSDLVPLRAGQLADMSAVRDEAGFTVPPYPYDHITPDTQFTLYLEVYHLAFDADDRTRYTVAYRIERQGRRDGIRGWLGATEEEVTTQSVTYQGTTRTAEEYIALDLSPYAEASHLRITVRVTDEVAGHHVERTIRFEVRGE